MISRESPAPTAGVTASRHSASTRVSEAMASGRLWIAVLAVVSLAAGAWIFHMTERGIGIGSDSAVYIAGARNLLEGRGFVWLNGDGLPRPINHYPPFYSTVLSAGLALGLTAEGTARVVNVVLMAASTFLVGAVAGLLAAPGVAAILAALLFAASEETLAVYSWAMSDSLYLFLALLCVTSATRSLRRGSSRLARVVMWGSAGLAFLTRYAGIALIAVPIVATWYGRKAERVRPRAAAAWLSLALIPGLAWMVRNVVLSGSATNRRFGLFPLDVDWWRGVGDVFAGWFLPGRVIVALEAVRVPAALAASALVGALALAVVLARRPTGGARGFDWVWPPLAVWIASHLVLVAVSSATGYPPPDVDTRILAPVFAALLVFIAAALGVVGLNASRTVRVAAVVVAVGFLAFKAYAGRDLVRRLTRDGQGYTSAAWSRSQTVEVLRHLAPDLVYTNDTGAAYYFTGDPAFQIPLRYDSVSGLERPGYHGEYCMMRARLRESGGLLVLFSVATSLPESPEAEEILQGLEPILEGPDGAIFKDGGGTLYGCDSASRLEHGPAVARRFR